MTQVPDGLPTLSAGPHLADDGLACVMEYVSVITGDEFTDYPKCTNTIIARVAQVINDSAETDEKRRMLLPFIDRLASATGHNASFERAVVTMLNEERRRQWYLDRERYSGRAPERLLKILGNNLAVQVKAAMVHLDTDGTLFVREVADMRNGLAVLSYLLDMHEQLVPHEVKPISPDALADARRLIETRALVV